MRSGGFGTFFDYHPGGQELLKQQEADAWKSKAKVEQTLLTNPRVDYLGGRCIKTDMSQYPQLDLSLYLEECDISMAPEEVSSTCIKNQSGQPWVTKPSFAEVSL